MTTRQAKHNYTKHHADRLSAHYRKAIEKHPYFCDLLAPDDWSVEETKKFTESIRKCIDAEIEVSRVSLSNLLFCEVSEMYEAYIGGDTAAAVEECYDAIAVLIRAIDVLEGRQKLGKPETKGNSK